MPVFYRVVYKPKLLRINKFTWNKFYVEALGNISALEALNASKPIILNDILHFLGPIGFEKIMSVSNKLINLLLSGSVVSYLVLNSWTLFLVVALASGQFGIAYRYENRLPFPLVIRGYNCYSGNWIVIFNILAIKITVM